MGTRVRVMDLEVDLLTEETLTSEIIEYLTNDHLNVIHIISLDCIDECHGDEQVRNELLSADLVLPGEKAILSAHHVDVLETGGMVVDYNCFLNIKDSWGFSERTYYLVMNDTKEAKSAFRYIANHSNSDNVVGVYACDSNVTEESLINDINDKLPDVVLLAMDSDMQVQWLERNKSILNAKLIVAMGSILPIVLRENIHVPKFFKVLHLSALFKRIARIPYAHPIRKRNFWQKHQKYTNRKQ